ncbi:hypothetical protein BKN38_08790 [Helicobacter sp. CLO-3]|uniref:GtrA family protein n=1 Tax=unclassified Helicobacter TaxID=2593540 RepID=UPI0008060508|nr:MULTISPECIES: GtrA family protein [unclassified Helicobacter]OBV28941.1 hypothetical protein BA723_07385 [Helicobacter sp. CLO-3]OHU81557.1 hypothetical protein BKN38_08790 [Helicobacter sp. CLO-3]
MQQLKSLLQNPRIQKILQNSAMKYAIVGGINTILCWAIIGALMWFGAIPEVANVIGYVIGVANSYVLNKKFTFKSQNSHKEDFVRFGVAMGAAYLVNLGVLMLCYRVLGINEYVSQIIAAVFYTISGYAISKLWAFKERR